MVVTLTPIRFFEYAEKIFSSKEAIVCEEERFTYKEFCRRVRKMSNALLKMGVQKGDRVAYLGYNCHRLLELFYAPVMIGAIIEPLNIRLTAKDFEYIIKESTPRLLFLDRDFVQVIQSIQEKIPKVEKFIILSERDGTPGWISGSYEEIMEMESDQPNYDSGSYLFEENDTAEIFYTSGTTGKPKGVMLTHRNVFLNALFFMSVTPVRETDIQIIIAGMFHANGWGTPHFLLAKGGKYVMVKKFYPEKVLELIQKERISRLWIVPTMANAILSVPNLESFDLSSVREIHIGGAPTPKDMFVSVEKAFGCYAHTAFGMTETSPGLVVPEFPENLPHEEFRHRRHETCGKPLPGVAVRLVDSNDKELPWDGRSIGELLVRSDLVMKGYYNQAKDTDEALKGGWFHTGDLCVLEPDGHLIVKDRKKDIIISGGENIPSIEIEEVLYTHPAILECAVIGKYDEKWGETPLALVVLREGFQVTPEEIILFARNNLAHFKAPRDVKIVSELPKSGTGKILKTILRERFRTI